MIVFKKIRWRNLLSTGNQWTELDLAASKATLIIGENGSGKSTFLDAISFVLFGKPYRVINKPQLINSINKKKLVVEVEFEIGKKEYLVRRGIKPNVFEIYENGTMLDQDASVNEYQEHLEKRILKIGHKSFCQVVVVGSAGFTPFMQLKTPDRRKVIEDLLDIEIFSLMSDILKSKVRSNKQELNDTSSSMELLEQKISLTKRHISELTDIADDEIRRKKESLKELISKYDETEKKAKTLSKELEEKSREVSDTSDIEEEISLLREKRSTMKEHRRLAKDTLDFYSQNDDCPTCGQHIDTNFLNEKIEENTKDIEELEADLISIEESIANCSNSLNYMREIQSQVQKMNQELLSLNNSMKNYHSSMNTISKELQTPSNSSKVEEHKIELKEIEDQLASIKEDYANLREVKALYDTATKMLKDGGIKTTIINQYVPVINSLVNKYLSAMDFFVQFEIDEQFNEKIKSRFRDEFSYTSFSEGEKMRIDLSLLFTWRAVAKLRNSASTNLLILDEVFDSSLDSNGTEEFMKLITQLSKDTNTFVISHKGDQLFDRFTNVIRFEKIKNFSQIAA